ncbi:hypothetical protein MTO96_014358, partial [Rhipicephalus appendiculatus]
MNIVDDAQELFQPTSGPAPVDANGSDNITELENAVHRDESLALIELAVLTFIFALTVAGNSCVLVALNARRSKMTRMYYFLVHLCVSDLTTAFFTVLPQLGWDATYRFQGGNLFCKCVKYGQILGPYLSSYVLVVTAVDRYQAICFPLSNCSWTPTKSKLPGVLGMGRITALLRASAVRVQLPGGGTGSVRLLGHLHRTVGPARLRHVVCRERLLHPAAGARLHAYRFKSPQGDAASGTDSSSYVRGPLVPRSHSSARGLSRAKIKTVKITVVVISFYIICSSPFICVQMWMYWGSGLDMSDAWT